MTRAVSRGELSAIQTVVRRSAKEYELGPDLGHFDTVIRLTLEFNIFLAELTAGPVAPNEIRYMCESVFSGDGCFCEVNADYRTMVGETDAVPNWEAMSFTQLNEEFTSKYQSFLDEKDFPAQIGLLLDLFRLQLVFTGMAYH